MVRETQIQINCDSCGRDISTEYFVLEVRFIHSVDGMPSHPINTNQELCFDCVQETIPSLKGRLEELEKA